MSTTQSNKKSLESADKWRYTLYTTFVLLILFNPYTYKFMNSIFSGLASKKGCPTMSGFLIHATIFTLIVRYLMDLRI